MAEKTNIELIDPKADEAATDNGGGCCGGSCGCGQ